MSDKRLRFIYGFLIGIVIDFQAVLIVLLLKFLTVNQRNTLYFNPYNQFYHRLLWTWQPNLGFCSWSIVLGLSCFLGHSYMVAGTRDNPPPDTTLASVYMWKRFPYRLSQSWPCMIIHNSYWIIKCADVPLSLSFPRSFDHSGFFEVNFHFFNTNFCFNPLIPTRYAESYSG